MSEESAVLEPESTETTEFDHTKYRQYFPADVAEVLEDVFTNRKFGHLRKSKLLQDIDKYTKLVQERTASLIQSCQHNPRGAGRTAMSTREHGRLFLAGLSEDKLKVAAEQANVSWNSFVKPGSTEYSEVIEAILDEMGQDS